ncbi:SGNH/GDSL hydrolase family protein [Streptomyces bullii]|uniref:SGNH/GDSL hydrolase family protein n=1 Tax=Streptomyces bullii TaxID=349910 RepID=A0ABW0UUV0_9ACTN
MRTFHPFAVRGFTDQTVRQTLRPAGSGEALRIRLSNRYGTAPLEVGGAHLAVRTRGSGIDPATDTTLLFAGLETATVPPGDEIVTDPAEQPVTAGEELALSPYVPGDTGLTTYSAVPYDIGHATPGNRLTADHCDTAEELPTGHFVTGVDVRAPHGTRIAVAFGDSWIEGMNTTPGTGSAFPAQLNSHLTRGWIVNQGISGNRLLTDEIGEHLLAASTATSSPSPAPRTSSSTSASTTSACPAPSPSPTPANPHRRRPDDRPDRTRRPPARRRTHRHRQHHRPLRRHVYPGYDTEEGQSVRREVNTWLLGDTHPLYAVADLAAAVADPDRPDRIRDAFNSGDGLHVNDAGAKALADAVDLTLLRL